MPGWAEVAILPSISTVYGTVVLAHAGVSAVAVGG